MDTTSLRLTPLTRDRLKSLKIHRRETYDDVISRILDAKLGNMRITYKISSRYHSVYAIIDYDLVDRNIVYEFDNCVYDDVGDLPLPVGFKKMLRNLDLFDILPPLDSGEEVVFKDICFKNITLDMR